MAACVYLLPPWADNRRIGAEVQIGEAVFWGVKNYLTRITNLLFKDKKKFLHAINYEEEDHNQESLSLYLNRLHSQCRTQCGKIQTLKR